jgi:hypothetical protein
MTYWGDLNSPNFPTNIIKNSGIAAQISYRRFFKKRYAVRGSFAFGSLKGADRNSTLEWQKLRNLDFHSSIQDVSLMAEYYVFGFDTDVGSSIFTPYLAVGISAFRFNPKTYYQGNEIRLQPLGTEGQGLPGFDPKYKLISFGMPMGGGGRIFLNEKVTLGAEIIMRWTATDYIDDISGYYVTYDDLRAGNGALSANLSNRMNEFLGQEEPVVLSTGSQRGGPSVNDFYFVSTISVNVLFENRKKGSKRKGLSCPSFK